MANVIEAKTKIAPNTTVPHLGESLKVQKPTMSKPNPTEILAAK